MGINSGGMDEERPFFKAVRDGNEDLVDEILKESPDVINTPGNFGETPLGYSIITRNLEMAKLLLTNGADPNAKSLIKVEPKNPIHQVILEDLPTIPDAGEKFTPLFLASWLGLYEIIEILLEKGADIDNNEPYTALVAACIQDYGDCAKLFIDENANVDLQNKYGETAINIACGNGDLVIIHALIEKRADLELKDVKGITPLQRAIIYPTSEYFMYNKSNYFKMVDILIDAGADVNTKDNKGYTPLHYAVQDLNDIIEDDKTIDIINILTEKGADVDAKDNYGFTPLHIAVDKDYLEIVNVLISKGADVNAKDNDEFTPLHYAAYRGWIGVIDTLMSNGADIRLTNKHGFTALHTAIEKEHTDIVKHLLNHPKSKDIVNLGDLPPIMQAVQKVNEKGNIYLSIIELLLDKGAIVTEEIFRRANSASLKEILAAKMVQHTPQRKRLLPMNNNTPPVSNNSNGRRSRKTRRLRKSRRSKKSRRLRKSRRSKKSRRL